MTLASVLREKENISMRIIGPPAVCIAEEWAPNSNVAIAVIGGNAADESEIIEAIAHDGDRRRDLAQFLDSEVSETVISQMYVTFDAPDFRLLSVFEQTTLGRLDQDQLRMITASSPYHLHQIAHAQSIHVPVLVTRSGVGIAPIVILPSEKAYVEGSRAYINVCLQYAGVILAEGKWSPVLSYMGSEPPVATATNAFRKIFASYAREDIAIVEALESIIHALAVGELRWDLRILRAGDDWQSVVVHEIESADVFQLFWSRYSASSDNVRAEWEYALSLHRSQFVRPVYWSEPLIPPPPALSRLHFAKIRLNAQPA